MNQASLDHLALLDQLDLQALGVKLGYVVQQDPLGLLDQEVKMGLQVHQEREESLDHLDHLDQPD